MGGSVFSEGLDQLVIASTCDLLLTCLAHFKGRMGFVLVLTPALPFYWSRNMIEKTKLSLWDFFVSTLSGYAIILSILTHCLFKGIITWKSIFDSPSALLAIAGLLTIILAGLLFEPLANYATKLLTTCPWNYRKTLGFKSWDPNIKALENKARKDIPDGIEENTYHYCLNWLHQNASDDSYIPFLAKYGFYRSMSLLLLLNAGCVLFIYPSSYIKLMIFLLLITLTFIYFYRSRVFYRHMNVTIYSSFISIFNLKKGNQ